MQNLYLPSQTNNLVGDEFCRLNIYGFKGRIGRLRYAAWLTVLIFIAVLATALLFMLFRLIANNHIYSLLRHYDKEFTYHAAIYDIVFYLAYCLVFFLPGLAVLLFIGFFSTKRLHDLGFSGWFSLLLLLPGFNLLLMALLLIMPANNGRNRYGLPPPPNSLMVYWLGILWLVPLPFLALWLLGLLFR